MNDPLVDEIRRIRETHAARFNYDLDAIFRDLKEQEKQAGHKFLSGIAEGPSQPTEGTKSAEDKSGNVPPLAASCPR
jgi:hypothetical protein